LKDGLSERQLNIIARNSATSYRFSQNSASVGLNGGVQEDIEDIAMTFTNTKISVPLFAYAILGSGLLLTVPTAGAAEELRTTVTTQGSKSAIDNGAGVTSIQEFDSKTPAGKRSARKPQSIDGKATAAAQAPNTDFWFYAVDVELYSDQDRDGYYSNIDLLFDADTNYAVADVYAVLYLSYEGGDWEEYAVTEDFTLFGTSADDEYIVDTELVSGYARGSYDILIELYDTWDNSFVADVGPYDTSELGLLPLEDTIRDEATRGSTVVVNNGGGGASGWLSLLVLLAACGAHYLTAPRREAVKVEVERGHNEQ
jgi:hypothetical protein